MIIQPLHVVSGITGAASLKIIRVIIERRDCVCFTPSVVLR